MNVLPTRRIAVIVLCGLALSGCAEFPLLGERPVVIQVDPQDVRLGAQFHSELLKSTPALAHPALQAYVDEVGQRLAKQGAQPDLTWHFTVLDSAGVNAYSLPGGYVYVTRGLLAYLNSEAELAAVLAHELGHVLARHGSAPAGAETDTLRQAVMTNRASGYGREREFEANSLGAETLARAGYNPQALLDVMSTLKLQERYVAGQSRADTGMPETYHGVLSMRSSRDARLQQAVAEADRHAVPLPRDGRNELLLKLDGLVFGERPEAVRLRDNLLLHDGFGLALQFPPEWQVKADARRAVAINPAGDARVEFRRGDGGLQASLQQAYAFDEGVRFSEGALSGYPAVFAAGSEQGHPMIAAAVNVAGSAYLVAGIAHDATAYTRERNTLRGTINSFRALSAAERESARPQGLRLITARPGMTLAGLAQQSPLGDDAETRLRLLNGFHPKGEPKTGQLIKIVQ
ncbi:MAG: M48 family metalloprotease [Gammaproteobacteria bacterium]